MDKRKIGFFYLHLSSKENVEDIRNAENSLPLLVKYICGLSKKIDRKYELTQEKFCFIDSFEFNEQTKCMELLFKSAKHSYRAPLLNKNTILERANPKHIDEGEQTKTHILLKFKDEDAIVFLETGQNCMTMKNIVDYINDFISRYNESSDKPIDGKFSFQMMVRDDYREVLNKMERVVWAEVFINKTLLASNAFNFSNHTEEVQENIILKLKSEKKKSLKTLMYDMVNRLNGTESSINRIKFSGKLDNENDCIVDTSVFIKREYIEVIKNKDTGECDSKSVFAQLRSLSNDY